MLRAGVVGSRVRTVPLKKNFWVEHVIWSKDRRTITEVLLWVGGRAQLLLRRPRAGGPPRPARWLYSQGVSRRTFDHRWEAVLYARARAAEAALQVGVMQASTDGKRVLL